MFNILMMHHFLSLQMHRKYEYDLVNVKFNQCVIIDKIGGQIYDKS